MLPRSLVGMLGLLLLGGLLPSRAPSAEPPSREIFARKNLVAWCIVPFDSRKRGPEDRAAMLEKLGFSKFAYDYRAEHIPTFDAEIEALKRHHVELTAWWFPPVLNDEARQTLAVFSRHKVTPQLWVTGGGGPTSGEADQKARVVAEAVRIRAIAEAADKVGCKVALYNHGGWFGEPENQIAIIQELKLNNVGIVYNLHHGHDHLDRFPELLQKMKPYLYALNLNGMVKEGDRKGQKILQLGEGDLDLKLLKVIRDSGYTGPIGILGHTQDDAEERLHDNLDGLDWLLPQLDGKEPGPKPRMRTPVPKAVAAAPVIPPAASTKPLVAGKFGQALDGRAGGALVAGRDEFRRFPITVECWARLNDKSNYNILVAHELKSSGTHWELFSMAGSGMLTAYCPGFTPDHCNSNAMVCDNEWHHLAMVLEPERIRLYVDGKQVADQQHKRTATPSQPGGLALASLVDKAIGCTGLIDEVRISKGVRAISAIPDKPFAVDDATVALWRLDELVDQKRLDDAAPQKNSALLSQSQSNRPEPPKGVSNSGKIEGHWGEDAIGFRWTESDSRDDRFGQVDSGSFFSGSITGPGGPVYKGIVVRLGPRREASLCYDTELMRVAAGWSGFIKFDPARFGIIVPPRIDGNPICATPRFPGVSLNEQFPNYREAHPYGPLPKDVAHYKGLYRNGERVVLKYSIGLGAGSSPKPVSECLVHETPWLETIEGATAITRTLMIDSSSVPIRMMIANAKSRVRLHPKSEAASIVDQPELGHVLLIASHAKPVAIKLLIASADTNEAAFDQLVAASPAPVDVQKVATAGPLLWGEPLVTRGEVVETGRAGDGDSENLPYVVETITLPFNNPYRALFFCSGHDFLPDGRAAVCTLHGDVWLVDGIDATLKRITWRRFATGLFQPLGLKVVKGQVYVVGRDQITRLLDLNGDGEADLYENFNNDAHVTLNGHEYVTCLETDRAGNFYYVKGNCNSQTPHDGSLLRVSADGSRLDVFATGFRNSNGIGMGPNDEITVAPQEGEWTPASGVFLVHEGGFYGGMMSHHRATPPTDFERPLVWFPRQADNSSGGQVWTTSERWGPLSNHLLHMSYGQCRLRLVLRDVAAALLVNNGASIELPLRFNSGIHRGRMSPHDGQLYVTGLKGWTTSAVHDGCFQRVRYTGQPVDIPVGLRSYKNVVALTFTRELDRDFAEDPSNYQLEAWNYKWSAAYGSPELKPSAPGQTGRDEVTVRSVTLSPDNRTVFLELPELKPVDQLSIGYTLLSRDHQSIEQTAVLTLNSLSTEAYPEQLLHRRTEDPEQAKLLASLVPGIVVQHSWNKPSATVLRLAAWNLAKGDVPAVVTAPGSAGAISATGWIRIPVTGRYRFSTASSTSTATIEIGKSPRMELSESGVELPLNRGLHPLTVVQQIPSPGEVQFRLMWENKRFPREAVPAAQFLHLPSGLARNSSPQAGAMLYQRFRCANCHDSSGVDTSPLETGANNHAFYAVLNAAPRLDGIGSRVNFQWISQWVRNPHQLRSDATMPGVIPPHDALTGNDIAAYLMSLRDPAATAAASSDTPPTDELIPAGSVLYERLGCIACHSFAAPDQKDEWNRVSLHHVNAKYQPMGLLQYLKFPQQHHTSSRMPDFKLTEAEAASIGAFIRREATGQLQPDQAPPGDVARGRVAFEKHRCAQCHLVEKSGQLAKPALPAVRWNPKAGTGCLAAAADPNGKAPHFPLTEEERALLLEFGNASPAGQMTQFSEARSIDGWIRELRCNACHPRDSQRANWPEIIAEEGSGRAAETVPQLTWVGEKLQGPWVQQILSGQVQPKPRPWLAARMPAFPAYASLIAHGMAAEHGVPFEEPLPASLSPEQIEIGSRLTMRDGGLDCRQCHGVGKEQPRGDASTQIALGINFAMVRQRLRPEFALRQMLDPPRYDIGSRMPRFAPDLKTTAARHIENGDARRQFESLKQFIWSVKEDDLR